MDILIGRAYPDKIIAAVNNAKSSIDILIYDWRWYPNEQGARIQKFNNAVIAAMRRGVRVRARVNNTYICTPLQQLGVDIKKVDSKKTMHVKMLIFDEQLVFFGSHNLTKNAFEMNHEISVAIDEADEVAECQQFFNNIV